MSNIIEAFEECLNSNRSCEEVYQRMNKISEFKLHPEINELKLIKLFLICIKTYFKEELDSFKQLELCNELVFKLSQKIMSHKAKYKENEFYERLELFYQTFFFYEFSEDNESNDYTFYTKLSEHLIEPDIYKKYLLNIGDIILSQKDYSMLINILFSSDTPEFLRNIILTCFEYIREKNKKEKMNYLDFLKLCVPSLNHYNLYYLTFAIQRDLGLKISQISEIHYIKLEKYIQSYTQNTIENEPDELDDEKDDSFINLEVDKCDDKSPVDVPAEEIEKYFNFPNEDDKNKVLEFIKSNNLESNKNKFLRLIKYEKDQTESAIKYKINYDNPEIDEQIINACSLPFLLKYKLINNIDEHFFQIYNYGNKRIEMFSAQLSKYLKLINKLLQNSLTKKEKILLLNNSGFYKLNNEYIFLINVDEEEENYFFLKNNLGNVNITSVNSNEKFKVYYVKQSDFSSSKYNSEAEYYYSDNDFEEEVLYNFGNYSFENDLRTFIKRYINENKLVYELPRLFFSLNYSIPISEGKFKFITSEKYQNVIASKNNNNKSYGYGEMDFVLKNESEEDISIDANFPPYKEKIFMVFPKENKKNINNNKKIFLKKKSIIFFEFKVSFPQYYWKNKFSHFFKKIKKFLEIYNKRGLYNGEYIQIYFIYDNIPDVYYIKEMMNYINRNFSDMFKNFEFGIYYFSRGVSLINNQVIKNNLEKKISSTNEYINDLEKKISSTNDYINEIAKLFSNYNTNPELKEKLNELNKKFNIHK